MTETYDLIVIGGGSGGVRAARRIAGKGARVLLAERSEMGGTCVNVGCVPKKLLYYAADVAGACRQARAYGYASAAAGAFSWQQLIANKNDEIRRLNAVYEKLLADAGVDIARGVASLHDANTVAVSGEQYRGERILLAAGGEPARPAFAGAELAALSNDLFFLPRFPKTVILIGAGYIALEFAGIFNGLGAQTTLCYRGDLPMKALDDDIRRRVADGMAARGIRLTPNATPAEITKDGDAYTLRLQDGRALRADLIVLATGRKPRVAELSLANAGITPAANGMIEVDEDYRAAAPSVYAIGDLINTPALTPVATAEAEVFARRVFDGDKSAVVHYDALPTAIFSAPGIAVAGMSEREAQAKNISARVDTAAFKPMRSAFGGAGDETYIKLISDNASRRVIGAQMVGEHAAEIMQGVAVALKAGATRNDFANTIGIHPTSAEEFVTLIPRDAASAGDAAAK